MTELGLGRRVEFDEASRQFPIRALLPPVAATRARSYTWRTALHRNQGSRPWCVDYAWCHEYAARPVVVPDAQIPEPGVIYRRAQQLDQWPGTNYDGTSVLAGAKASTELGRLDEYRWAFSLDELIAAVGYHGPAVMGTNYYEGMLEPQGTGGFITATGRMIGGHAYLLNSVHVGSQTFGIWQSWDWKTARISFADVERLLREDGEACVPVRRR